MLIRVFPPRDFLQEPPPEIGAAEISESLWFALWLSFCVPDEENFAANPDPQKVVELAEETNEMLWDTDES